MLRDILSKKKVLNFYLSFLFIFWTSLAVALSAHASLNSWNPGPSKDAILDFVKKVTHPGSPNYLPPSQRIAVFDNDGTLWSEQPIYNQFAFTLDRLKSLASQHPEWKNEEPFRSALAGDFAALEKLGEPALLRLLTTAYGGMSSEEFKTATLNWLTQTKNDKFHRTYDRLFYPPMLELMDYLRSKDFKIFIVSGGGVEFMRAFSEKLYGVPPERVVGSSLKLKMEYQNGNPTLVTLSEVDLIDDKDGKVVGIQKFIGQRPVLAFGNSDGDQQMLEWTTSGSGPRLGLILHHTDNIREVAYDRNSPVGRLDKALDEAPKRGWILVDMKKDWKVVFPAE